MLLQGADTHYIQNIRQFLAKPHIIRRGRLTAGTTGTLAAISIPEEPLAVPIFAEKVNGFLGFRATAVMRLQFNANKFQQGRMIMYYIPQGQVDGMCPGMRTGSLRRVTQLPNVQFDLSCDTEAILKIPYVSPTTHYNLLDETGPMAAFYLGVYSPLRYGTGVSYADWTLWVSFEDVELVTPTLPRASQPLLVAKVGDWPISEDDPDPAWAEKETNKDPYWGQSQAGTDRYSRMMPADKESSNNTPGPVESVLKDTTSLAVLATKIPLLSSIAAPASWVLSALTKTAAHFGWSNPLDESRMARMRNVIFPYLPNCDAVDTSLPLSLKVDNKIEVLDGFAGTNVDESNLAYIVSIPSFHRNIEWTTILGAGDTLFRFPLNPQTFSDTTTVGVTPNLYTVTDHSPMSYVSRFFKQWRGSIQFTFKIVKTGFHSGRLVFAYAPGYTDPSDISINDTDYLHREIMDIREGLSFTFVVPYASTQTWLLTESATNQPTTYGTVFLKVLNPLVCPDTVFQSVQVLCEVAMTPDAQFAVPNPTLVVPFASDMEVNDFVSQADVPPYGASRDDCRVNSNLLIGGAQGSSDQLTASKYCVGEDIVSFLQLLKRTTFTLVHQITATQSTALRPFTIGGAYTSTTVPSSDRSSFRTDLFSAINACYAYNRGGVRLSFVPSGSAFSGVRGDIYLVQTRTGAAVSAYSAANLALAVTSSCVPYDLSRDGGQQIQVPAYNRLHSRLSRLSFEDGTVNLNEPRDIYSSESAVVFNSTVTNLPTIRRQVADDFSVGFFLGVPRTISALLPT